MDSRQTWIYMTIGEAGVNTATCGNQSLFMEDDKLHYMKFVLPEMKYQIQIRKFVACSFEI